MREESGPVRRSSFWVWLLVIGLMQCGPTVGLMVRGVEVAANVDRFEWYAAPAIGGIVYVLLALPVMLEFRWAAMVTIVAAGAQVIALGALALLSIFAAGRAGEPGDMTIGVLVLGTLACIHLFVIRNLWPLMGRIKS